ncbi:LuxR C-terminal-related transcriptional regulator [Nocardioides sp. NPDC051685]|uniref:LuxR C-terminal-related transcriptional regulator n=1 Tax=Nocardioides sp. NPDC051685 TaxID=3364334 RepID=UPI0037B1DE6A
MATTPATDIPDRTRPRAMTITASSRPRRTSVGNRVAIVEPHPVLGEALELALSMHRFDARLLPASSDHGSASALTAHIVRSRAGIVILGSTLDAGDPWLATVAPLTRAGIDVIVLTSTTDPACWGQALRRGARAVVPKSRPLNDLISIVRRLAEGLRVLDVHEREELIAHAVRRDAALAGLRERFERLSARESEVLEHIMNGLTVSEIAALNYVSPATVRTQVKSILSKLEVTSQIAAVGAAHRLGWRPPRTPDHQARPLPAAG